MAYSGLREPGVCVKVGWCGFGVGGKGPGCFIAREHPSNVTQMLLFCDRLGSSGVLE